MTDVTGSGDTVENLLLPSASSSRTGFSSESVMVWGGTSFGELHSPSCAGKR